LESARDTISTVEFVDPMGRSWTVFVDKIGEAEYVTTGGPDSEMVMGIPIELLEWRSGTGIFRWNSDSVVYDETAKWSSGTDTNLAYWS
jgi:hypothetical protein